MGEKEKGPAGMISSSSSVGLPDICWPFQPCHPASHHHPPLLLFQFRVLSPSALLCFYSAEIRGTHPPAWSDGKVRRTERTRQPGRQTRSTFFICICEPAANAGQETAHWQRRLNTDRGGGGDGKHNHN